MDMRDELTQGLKKPVQGKADEGLVMPPIPSKWKSKIVGVRYVVDRTLGNKVVFSSTKKGIGVTCSLEDWHEYQKTAKRVD